MTCTCNAVFCAPGLGHEKGCGEVECEGCGIPGHSWERCPEFRTLTCCGAEKRCGNCCTTKAA